jgi:hypothetical protein
MLTIAGGIVLGFFAIVIIVNILSRISLNGDKFVEFLKSILLLNI